MYQSHYKKLLEAKWSADVKTKWHPKAGLFASGSASDIASAAESGHGGNKGEAIKALQFYINRAGDNLSSDRKNTIEAAISKLQK